MVNRTQVNLSIDSDLIIKVDDLIKNKTRKWRSRSHFFEELVFDYLKKIEKE